MATVTIIEPKKSLQFTRKRVAAYARVSIEKELSENSFKAQVEYFSKKISNNPTWINAGVYADYGLTGTKIARPGFENLIKACENGQIDMIITKSISRFCRNTVDLLNTTRHLKDLGINVFFERENLYSISYEGELLLTLLASFAQEEARSASENNKLSVKFRFKKGMNNAFVLYGYRWNGEEFLIEPHEAEVVKEIYNRYLSGESPQQIAKSLNKRGETSVFGNPFRYSLVWNMLRLEKYKGDSHLQKVYCEDFLTKRYRINEGQEESFYVTGTHPVIIDEHTWTAVQKEIARRAAIGVKCRKNASFSCFSGNVYCADCGAKYSRRQRNGYHIWKCRTKLAGGRTACNAQNLPEEALYDLTRKVLNVDDLTDNVFQENIDRILVSSPLTLTFVMKEGKTITETWECRTSNKNYWGYKDGKNSNNNSSNAN